MGCGAQTSLKPEFCWCTCFWCPLQPLTPMLHLSDMRWADPNYTGNAMRVLKALALSLADLEDLYQQRLPQAKNVRTKHLRQEVPYKLHK